MSHEVKQGERHCFKR